MTPVTLASLLWRAKHGTIVLPPDAFDDLVSAGGVVKFGEDLPERRVRESAQLFFGEVFLMASRERALTAEERRARREALEVEPGVDPRREALEKDRALDGRAA